MINEASSVFQWEFVSSLSPIPTDSSADTQPLIQTYGGFLKWGYPQIIHINGIFPYKPSSYWGTPILWNPPYIQMMTITSIAVVVLQAATMVCWVIVNERRELIASSWLLRSEVWHRRQGESWVWSKTTLKPSLNRLIQSKSECFAV